MNQQSEIYNNFLSTKQGKIYKQTCLEMFDLMKQTEDSYNIELYKQLKKLEIKEVRQRVKWVIPNNNMKWYELLDYIQNLSK